MVASKKKQILTTLTTKKKTKKKTKPVLQFITFLFLMFQNKSKN